MSIYSEYLPILTRILETRRPGARGFSWDAEQYAAKWASQYLTELGIEHQVDADWNLIVDRRETGAEPAFTCHTDTVEDIPVLPVGEAHAWLGTPRKLTVDGVMLKLAEPAQEDCLGADDGAGMAIMLAMILEGVPGLYLFFSQEEVGRVGSTAMADRWDNPGFDTSELRIMLSFDRRNSDIVVSQMFRDCVSVELSEYLREQFTATGPHEYVLADGVYTDSASFLDLVPECGNIGVGYENEHGSREYLDLSIWRQALETSCDKDTWAAVPHRSTCAPKQVYRAPQWGYSLFAAPQGDAPESVRELLTVAENATDDELLAYARRHIHAVGALLKLAALGKKECVIKDCAAGEARTGLTFDEWSKQLWEERIW